MCLASASAEGRGLAPVSMALRFAPASGRVILGSSGVPTDTGTVFEAGSF